MSAALRWRLAWIARGALYAGLWTVVGLSWPASKINEASSAVLKAGLDLVDRVEAWGLRS